MSIVSLRCLPGAVPVSYSCRQSEVQRQAAYHTSHVFPMLYAMWYMLCPIAHKIKDLPTGSGQKESTDSICRASMGRCGCIITQGTACAVCFCRFVCSFAGRYFASSCCLKLHFLSVIQLNIWDRIYCNYTFTWNYAQFVTESVTKLYFIFAL